MAVRPTLGNYTAASGAAVVPEIGTKSLRLSSLLSPFLKSATDPTSRSCILHSTRNSTFERSRGRKACTVTVKAFQAVPSDEKLAMATTPETLYEVLGIGQSASEKDIKGAYRKLARRYHPDVVPEEQREASTKAFLQIHAAYLALSDPESRNRYDLQIQARQAVRIPKDDRRRRRSSPSSYGGSGASSVPEGNSVHGSRPYRSFSRAIGRNWETDQCWC